jgi:hypothetical protein
MCHYSPKTIITTPNPFFFFFFWGVGGEGGRESPRGGHLTHAPVGTLSICCMTRRGENQTGSLRASNMVNEHTREIMLTSFIICPIPAGTQARNNDQRRLGNVAPHSILDQIQTTIPPVIAQFLLEVCISRGLTFLSPLIISVPGTSQLDQGYPTPTMH